MSCRRYAALGAFLLTMTAAPRALGQEAPDSAQLLFQAGAASYRDGRAADAIELFRQSMELEPRPVTGWNLALAERTVGDFVAAIRTVDRLTRGDFGAIEDELRSDAIRLRAELSARVATLVVSVVGAPVADVDVDGEAVGRASSASPLTVVVNPGAHRVDGHMLEARASTSYIDAEGGAEVPVSLRFVPVGTSTAEIPALETPSPSRGIEEEPAFWGVLIALVVLGAGAGAVGGVVASDAAAPLADPVFGVVYGLSFSY